MIALEALTAEEFVVDITEETEIAFGEPSEPAPADRVAGIIAADTADDDTQDIPTATISNAVALTLSDAALADMADDFGAAEAEAAGEGE